MEDNNNKKINIYDTYTIYPDKTAGGVIEIRPLSEKDEKKRKKLNKEKHKGRAFTAAVAILLSIALLLASGAAFVFAIGSFIDKTKDGGALPTGSNKGGDEWVNPGELVSNQALINATKYAYDSVVSITITQGEAKSSGSGVILTSDGYIVTNHHVIEGEGDISVTLSNGKKYNATFIASDRQTDLGIIKIDAKNLRAATLGSTDDIILGAAVIAIGNPLGYLAGTVTTGIIGGIDRNITIEGQKMTLIQTDAAVNPGNSGGGLFNIDGKLIGIVNAKSVGTNISGLGYAIPIDVVKDITSQLIEKQYIAGRSKIGIRVVQITSTNRYEIESFAPELVPYVNGTGVYVLSSDNEALKTGDKIESIDKKTITETSDVLEAISEKKVGDELEVVVVRKNTLGSYDRLTLKVKMLEKTAEDFKAR